MIFLWSEYGKGINYMCVGFLKNKCECKIIDCFRKVFVLVFFFNGY